MFETTGPSVSSIASGIVHISTATISAMNPTRSGSRAAAPAGRSECRRRGRITASKIALRKPSVPAVS